MAAAIFMIFAFFASGAAAQPATVPSKPTPIVIAAPQTPQTRTLADEARDRERRQSEFLALLRMLAVSTKPSILRE